MHYHFEVWVPVDTNIEYHVEEALKPYQDKLWDWWQIGGRWKGVHVRGYEADKDPEHIETCILCNGTGTRPDGLGLFGAEWVKEMNGCNGCKGEGKRTSWPTAWRPHKGDVLPVSGVPPDLTCNTLILPGNAISTEVWTGEKWQETGFDGKVAAALKENHMLGGFIVTVDCHD